MSSLKSRVAALEQAAQPSAEYEILWNMSSGDYEVWAVAAGSLDDYLALMAQAGLLWLSGNEKIVGWWLDVGDGGVLQAAPVVRHVRYTRRGGWGTAPDGSYIITYYAAKAGGDACKRS